MALVETRMASIVLPEFLEQPTGLVLYDVMPCATLLVTIPTLMVYTKTRRFYDVFAAAVSIGLAFMFHLCHMHMEGIQAVRYFGLDGVMWRTLDILAAQIQLARTFGHAIGDAHPGVSMVPNVLLPVVHLASLFNNDSLEMRYVVGVTCSCLLLTLLLKLILDGWEAFPRYSGGAGLRVLSSFVAAFACFVMPHAHPSLYWFWHSAWHVLLGVGYYELYCHLTGTSWLPTSSSTFGSKAKEL